MSNSLALRSALAAAGWQACTSALRLDRWMLGELGQSDSDEVRAHVKGVRMANDDDGGDDVEAHVKAGR